MSKILTMAYFYDLPKIELSQLNDMGPASIKLLNQLGINNIAELLLHLPRGYEDRRLILPIAHIRPGQKYLIRVNVRDMQNMAGPKGGCNVLVDDESGKLSIRYFKLKTHQLGYTTASGPILFYGEVKYSARTGKEMIHPERLRATNAPGIVAIYPVCETLSQSRFRKWIAQALDLLSKDDPYHTLIKQIHVPDCIESVTLLEDFKHPAQVKLIIEELAAQHLKLFHVRRTQSLASARSLKFCQEQDKWIRQRLGFSLTGAQERVINEILADLYQSRPMLRLVQGDVGSGKTAVAALIATQALAAGWQVAVMAPTDLLAEQLYQRMQSWFEPSFVVVFLSGRLKKSERRVVHSLLQTSQPLLAIGTHALFQEDVVFSNLGLIIIDEQHRFGVEQRLALRNKAAKEAEAHVLIMTATPIPRTLSMSLLGDLDQSVLDERPPGRQSIITRLISLDRIDELCDRLHHHCQGQHRAYWVCPLIEESEVIPAQAAELRFDWLRNRLPELRIAIIHGRISAVQRHATMSQFQNGELDVLVATTVIEVGVDVPEATLMIIENPERLGLAQLHQLRGRVGRGADQSYCILLFQQPLSPMATERLSLLRQTEDGFALAEADLRLRGPGEMLGVRQSGLGQGRIADLERDAYLLEQARTRANALFEAPESEQSTILKFWTPHADEYSKA